MTLLEKAARAVVERWDTPLWKDAPATAEYITALREALEQPSQGAEDTTRLDWLLWKLPGDALRYVVGEISDTSDAAEFRAAIDAARTAGETP